LIIAFSRKREAYTSLVRLNKYLYTFSKNYGISSVRKHYCALGVRVKVRIRVNGNAFLVKRVFEQALVAPFQ